MIIMKFSGLLILAYLLGAIPWGLILARIFASADIRRKGSGNIGATNVTREVGILPGLLTLAGDVFKGALPVYLARLAFGAVDGSGDIYLAAAALAAFIGHCFPVYLKFRDGGKGVATAAGCFAVISLPAVLAAFGLFAVMLLVSRRVSAGSLCAAAALPVSIWVATGSLVLMIAAALTALLIFVRHHANIRRLLAGNEPAFKL
ncbi:MAG: glycerol-3-phosphate 1-O-acyltransferase PlsY [Desulfobacterales bacterium]|jgi:glycerol-3-phosphate acyltransferase PlsY